MTKSANLVRQQARRHECFIEEFEAGLALQGWKLNPARRKSNISDSYHACATEAFLFGAACANDGLHAWCTILPVP